MITDVKNALASIVGSVTVLRNPKGAGRLFELYVMLGIGVELRRQHYDVWVQRSDGTRIAPTDSSRCFVQRGGSPTGIISASLGPNNASTILFRSTRSTSWTILNGIQFEGRSKARHEIDIAVVPEPVAQQLRSSPSAGIPKGRPRVSIECKDVQLPGSIDETRAFVARLYDLTLLNVHHPHLGLSGVPQSIYPNAPFGNINCAAQTYFGENRRTLNVIARKSGFVLGSYPLLQYYGIEGHPDIYIGSSFSTQLMTDVANWIRKQGY